MDRRSEKLDYTNEWEDPELDALIEERCLEEEGYRGAVVTPVGAPRESLLARAIGVGYFEAETSRYRSRDYTNVFRLLLWLFDFTMLFSDPLAYILRLVFVAGFIGAVWVIMQLIDAWRT